MALSKGERWMRYVCVIPEIAGEHGENSVFDRSTTPFEVIKLHHVFSSWLGDAIVRGYRCYIVTTPAAAALQTGGMSGICFADVKISTDLEYDEAYPDRPVPSFVWLQIVGKPGQDDFGMARNNHLVMSERASQILSPFGIEHALIAPFSQDDGVVPETFTSNYIVNHENR
jgi:hypothetical protein